MDHQRLADINNRNARTAKVMGNRKMVGAYEGLARYHQNLDNQSINQPTERYSNGSYKNVGSDFR